MTGHPKGKLLTRTIGVNARGKALTEAEAVERALNSLRKTIITRRFGSRFGEWALPPKVIDVVPKQRWKVGIERTINKHPELMRRYRDTA